MLAMMPPTRMKKMATRSKREEVFCRVADTCPASRATAVFSSRASLLVDMGYSILITAFL
jgi:hypothetical protein